MAKANPADKATSIEKARDRRRKKISTDQKLLMAMEALLKNGEEFSTTTIERLSEAAGISRATFYLNYKDKGDLVTHLFEQVKVEIIESAGQWFVSAGTTTYDDIKRTIRGILGVYKEHYVILSALHQTAQTNPELAIIARDFKDGLCEASCQALIQLRQAGRANTEADDMVARLLTLAIDNVSTLQPELLDERNFQISCDAWSHITWSALVAIQNK